MSFVCLYVCKRVYMCVACELKASDVIMVMCARKPGLNQQLYLSLTVLRWYSHLSLYKCVYLVSACALCFYNNLHSRCFYVLVLYCWSGCLLCMLCFLSVLFSPIDDVYDKV